METIIKTYGEKNTNTRVANFIDACLQKAIEADCNILEVHIHNDFRYPIIGSWAQAAFMVDRFGGIAALVSCYEDGTYSYSTDAKTHRTANLAVALEGIPAAYKMEAEARANVEIFNCD
jgi:hypothetical protein